MARNAPSVDAYGDGGFRLAGEWRDGSVLIVGDEARTWDVKGFADLSLASLQPVLDAGRGEVEVLLLGVGPKNALPPREVRAGFAAAGIGLEFMDTPAAAKLYNFLTAEGRRVAAALIAV
jgi:uncharacterized protein